MLRNNISIISARVFAHLFEMVCNIEIIGSKMSIRIKVVWEHVSHHVPLQRDDQELSIWDTDNFGFFLSSVGNKYMVSMLFTYKKFFFFLSKNFFVIVFGGERLLWKLKQGFQDYAKVSRHNHASATLLPMDGNRARWQEFLRDMVFEAKRTKGKVWLAFWEWEWECLMKCLL